MRKNQKGFHALEALLILVLVGIIAGTGWYVWQSNKKTNKTLSEASSVKYSQPTKKQTTSSKSTISTQTNTQLFVIKEWGVKAPHSGNLTLTIQSIDNQSVVVSSKELLAHPDATGCIGPKSTNFVIQRYGPNEYTTDDRTGGSGDKTASQEYAAGTSFLGNKLVKVGNYYYLYQLTEAPCAQSVYEQNSYFVQTDQVFKALVPKLEAAPTQ